MQRQPWLITKREELLKNTAIPKFTI